MTIEERQARLREIAARVAVLSAATQGENARDLTDEEMSELESLETEAQGHTRQVEASQRATRVGAATGARQGRSTAASAAGSTTRETQAQVTGGSLAIEADPMMGFRSTAEFFNTVRQASRGNGEVDERLTLINQIERSLASPEASSGTPTHTGRGGDDLGWVPPTQIREAIWDEVYDPTAQDIFNLITPEPTGAGSVKLYADEVTPWAASGIKATRRIGRDQLNRQRSSNPQPRLLEVSPLYVFLVVDEDLLADAPRLQDRLTTKSAEAIRWELSEEIMRGQGQNGCLGILQSNAKVVVDKVSGQAADTIVAANVATMFSRLLSFELSRAVWLANPDTLPQLVTMTLDGNLLYMPPSRGFQDAPGGTLMGRPVVFNEHSSTLGDVGDLMLFSPRGYYLAMRQNIQAAVSMHLFFDWDEMAFRWKLRCNGQPWLSAPVSPANGSNTRSHFVTLAARA